MPKDFNVQKFIATFCLEVQKNPKLAQCTNLIEVARDVASFGLVIGGLANQAYLIPFDKKRKIGNEWTSETTAQLIIGYRGYITKLEEAGYTVEAEIVTNEEIDKGCFQEIRGSETKIIHNPIRKGIRDRENIALAYCIIKGNNTAPVISVLSKEEIEEIGKTSKWVDGKKEIRLSDVWLNKDRATDFGQQCIKTVIRNAVKKVNLRIANEMSAYEGQRDAEIMKNITPNQSKTANAHNIPAAIEQSFEAPIKMAQEKEVVQIDKEPEVIEQENIEDKADQIYDKIKSFVKSAGNKKALDTFWATNSVDIGWLFENKQSYHADLLVLKTKRLEEFK